MTTVTVYRDVGCNKSYEKMSMAFTATKINMKTSMNMIKNTYKNDDTTKMTTVSTSSTQMEKLIPNIPLVSMIVIGSRFLY